MSAVKRNAAHRHTMAMPTALRQWLAQTDMCVEEYQRLNKL